MGYYTAAQIATKIDTLDTAIAKAESAQSYQAGAGLGLTRGDLRAMYAERERLVKEYEKASAAESGGGAWNKGYFKRP